MLLPQNDSIVEFLNRANFTGHVRLSVRCDKSVHSILDHVVKKWNLTVESEYSISMRSLDEPSLIFYLNDLTSIEKISSQLHDLKVLKFSYFFEVCYCKYQLILFDIIVITLLVLLSLIVSIPI